MFIIGAASIFGWLITMEQVALVLYNTIQVLTTQKWLILLLVDAILLFLGCFIEGVAIMMISIPALIPLSLILWMVQLLLIRMVCSIFRLFFSFPVLYEIMTRSSFFSEGYLIYL